MALIKPILGDDSANWVKIGVNCINEGKLFEAHGCFYNALNITSQNNDAWAYLGILLSIKKNPEFIRCFGMAKIFGKFGRSNFRKIIDRFDSFELDEINDLMEKFDSAGSPFDEKIRDVNHLIRALQPELEHDVEENNPKIRIQMVAGQFYFHEWNTVVFQIENIGKSFAKDVALTYDKKFDIRDNRKIGVDGEKIIELPVMIYPREEGTQALTIHINYQNKVNKKFSDIVEVPIPVIKRRSDLPVKPAPVNEDQTPSKRPIQVEPTPILSPPIDTPPQVVAKIEDKIKNSLRFEDFLKEKYIEFGFLGKGGFSLVYKVKKKSGQQFAVKTPLTLDPSSGKVFIREISTWENLEHQNIVKIFDFNVIPFPYIEMELCDGSLKEWLVAQNKLLSPVQIASIIFDVCEGLKYAHARQIIHRDLKPQNILLKNGIPKITDWGLARFVTQSSTASSTSFTPKYAAPEQFQSKTKKDERTDIWQLGVIMYEMSCNDFPFNGEDSMELLYEIKEKAPTPPSQLNPDHKKLEPIILKCLEKSPKNRYSSVIELQKALAGLLQVSLEETIKMVPGEKCLDKQLICILGDFLVKNMRIGDLPGTIKYLNDLVSSAPEPMREEIRELLEELMYRMENGIDDIPEELIQKADILVHKLNFMIVS